MRPSRSFLLLFLILICLTGLYFAFPSTGLFPSPDDFIAGLDRLYQARNKTDTADPVPEEQPYLQDFDSIQSPGTVLSSVYDTITGPLTPFFDSLKYPKKQVRVLYYGDSQLEGDRVTFYLRQLLRKENGGTGPGLLLPVMPVMYTKSVWIRSSENWKRYNYLSYKSEEIEHTRFGPFMSFCRYMPEGFVSDIDEKAFVRIRPTGFADTAVSEFDNMRLFYSNPDGNVNLIVKSGDKILYNTILEQCSDIKEFTCNLNKAGDISLEFSGKSGPSVYGISIESATGVIVDNIPQRGSAGLEFTLTDTATLRYFYDCLKPDLFILQYGLNIVKNVRHDYSYYKKGLVRQIETLKQLSKGTPIIVVGVTDMAYSEGDTIRSYDNIPGIIAAQKEASAEAGAWFWDPYIAMGGEGSIIKWAQRKPPLGQNDYVHFTYSGADTLAKMLFQSIENEKPEISHSLIRLAEGSDSTERIIQISENVTNVTKSENNPLQQIVNQVFGYFPDRPFIFTLPAFWIFLLISLAVYSLIYKKLFLRNAYLLIISLYFYYKSGGLFLFLLILVTVIDYTCGLLIYRYEKKGAKRFFILLSIFSNIGMLAYFKYTAFFAQTINDLFGSNIKVYDFLAEFSNNILGTSFDISTIILPVGISFFTFQSLSYTIDVFRNKIKPVTSIVDFGFYVSFFPQLVAGPIVRASEFIPQLYNDYHLSDREFRHALFMICKGLIKKIVISDFLAITLIDRVFDTPALFSGFENLMAVYAYGLQIYCDFSGYTDIAIGIGLLFGFRLPINFNSPYKASGVSEFWKRWHISLSRWLKDYLYIPLGGSRKGRFRTGINLMLTMLIGGLWHGASLRFILWGALHGIGLLADKTWIYLTGEKIRSSWVMKFIGIIVTFNFVNFCWIFFRANDMESALMMLRQIWENFSPGSYSALLPVYGNVLLAIAVGYIIHFLPEKIKESYRGLFIKIPVVAQILVLLAIAVFLYQMRNTGIMPFIYFRF